MNSKAITRRHALAILSACAAAALGLAGCGAPAETEEARSASGTPTVSDQVAPDSAQQASPTAPSPAVARVVCIDPGHGANVDLTPEPIGEGATQTRPRKPGGATGTTTGVPEYEVVLDIGLKLREKLEAQGYTVVMVRTTNDVDISSKERAAVANGCDADLFVRLHCDGADSSSPHGFSTLVPGENEWTEDICQESQRAGQIMHPICVSETGARDAGVVERDDLAGFNYSKVPVVLFEMGFLSNPDEELKLVSDAYQDTLACAISDATAAYFAQTPQATS